MQSFSFYVNLERNYVQAFPCEMLKFLRENPQNTPINPLFGERRILNEIW